METRGYKIFNVFNVLIFIILSAIMLIPLINVLCLSLEPEYIASEIGVIHLIPKEITFKAYAAVWAKGAIKTAFFNSVFVTTIGASLAVFVTAMLGYALSNDEVMGVKAISYFVLFTMMFSGGIIPSYLLMKNLNLIDSLWSLIIPAMVSAYNTILMKSFFKSLPKSLNESAMIDGANEVTIFFKIIIPLSMPIIATITLFYAVGRWNSFFDAVMYITNRDKKTLQVLLREILVQSVNTDTGTDIVDLGQNVRMATAVVAIVPILCVYPFLQKYFTKGVLIGAVKG